MTSGVAAWVRQPAPGVYQRALSALRNTVRRGLRFRLRCLILGHEDAFARYPHRLMLRCGTCGRETVGWAIGPETSVAKLQRPTVPGHRRAAFDGSARVGPWSLRRRDGRRDAHDRQRQRLVAAASRAAESLRAESGVRKLDVLGPVGRWTSAGVADEAAAAVRAIAKRLA